MKRAILLHKKGLVKTVIIQKANEQQLFSKNRKRINSNFFIVKYQVFVISFKSIRGETRYSFQG